MSAQIAIALVVLSIQIYRLVKALKKRKSLNVAPVNIWMPEGRELR